MRICANVASRFQQEARQDESGGRSGNCIAKLEGKTKIDFKEDIVFLTALIVVWN